MTYDFVVVDNHPGNLLRVTDSYFLQDAPANGPARFMALYGGRLFLCGIGMYTPAGSSVKELCDGGDQCDGRHIRV